MRKDFKNLDIYAAFKPANGAEWQHMAAAILPASTGFAPCRRL